MTPSDLLRDELDQLRESGHLVDEFIAQANSLELDDHDAVLALVEALREAPREPGWRYDEPGTLVEIEVSLPEVPEPARIDRSTLPDCIQAAWVGRIAGNNVGKPVEWGDHWTVERIRDYLERAGAYPLDDYVPLLEPMPDGFELRENWPHTTRGNVAGADRDDDIDYTILNLHLLERHGLGLSPEHVGSAWLELFPLRQLYTAERAAYVNLVCGVTPTRTARHHNPYREWIGAQIRGDAFGYVLPGDPWAAAALAYQDASLSHVGNGIYGEMWAAALVAAAFASASAADALAVARQVVPPVSRLAEALDHVTRLHHQGATWEGALAEIRSSYGFYSWVHTINNAAITAAALLWSGDDYSTAVGRVVMSGWDTDSNGATVGSVMGALLGTAGIPGRFSEPLQDRTRSALFGFDNTRISTLAERTCVLALDGLH